MMKIIEIVAIDQDPVEYTCDNCLQLRLSLKGVPTECGNCGSKRITTGVPGSLTRPEGKS